MNNKSFIFIGFKHVGKSTLSKIIATHLALSFLDLDAEIQNKFEKEFNEKNSCSQIVEKHGEFFFRNLEHLQLTEIMKAPPGVLSLGGGTPINLENQKLLQGHILIHITAEPLTVFERIISKGLPAFFPSDEESFKFFLKLWKERERIYKKIASLSIENNESLENSKEKALEKLSYFLKEKT